MKNIIKDLLNIKILALETMFKAVEHEQLKEV